MKIDFVLVAKGREMRQVVSCLLVVASFTWFMERALGRDPRDRDPNERARPRISLLGLEANEPSLVLRYQITNGSAQDFWVCTDMNTYGKLHFEAVLGNDGHILIVRRRLDIPADRILSVGLYGLPAGQPVGTYTRLRAGAQRNDSVLLKLPVACQRILSRARPTSGITYATQLALQISFYAGDLPAAIRDVLADAERISEDYSGNFIPLPTLGTVSAKDLWQINSLNRTLDSTTNQVVIPYGVQNLMRAHLLQITVDGMHIPYRETSDSTELPSGFLSYAPRGTSGIELLHSLANLQEGWEMGYLQEPPWKDFDRDASRPSCVLPSCHTNIFLCFGSQTR